MIIIDEFEEEKTMKICAFPINRINSSRISPMLKISAFYIVALVTLFKNDVVF